MLRPTRHRLSTTALRIAASVILTGLMLGIARPAPAHASTRQISIVEDDTQLFADPGETLAQIRRARRRRDPADGGVGYDRAGDEPLQGARPLQPRQPRGISRRQLGAALSTRSSETPLLTGSRSISTPKEGAPLWATGPRQPVKGGKGYPFHNWEPSAAQYGLFVHALAVRYSGNYDPNTNKVDPGNPADLPRVSFWSLWNQPDDGPSLAPQALPGPPRRGGLAADAPRAARCRVVGLACNGTCGQHDHLGRALHHATPSTPQTSSACSTACTRPLAFLRALYCVTSSYHELRGVAAQLRGCPTTAAGSARFRSQNPVLFNATAISDHPYQDGLPPNEEVKPSPNGTGLTRINQLEQAVVRLNAIYGVHRKYPIYVTEFGYITSPPKPAKDSTGAVTPAQAAYYDNWAEYVMWKNPLIMSFDQYLLQDPDPMLPSNKNAGFASGLTFWGASRSPVTTPGEFRCTFR